MTPIYLIQIPIETTCDPGTLLDIAIELGGQAAAEATECANSSLEATVDEQEILVRPAGLTDLERDLLAALESILVLAERDLGNPSQARDLKIIAAMSRAAVAKAGGAKPAEPQSSYRCDECKGTDIQCAVWVNPNTREAFDDFGSWNNIDTQWCNYCGEHTIFETLPTFTIVHPGGTK